MILHMRNTAGLFLLFASLSAVAQMQPPPEVDAALRDRVTRFYEVQREGKWFAATQYVADDSKDAFIESAMRRVVEFQFQKTTYSCNFTRADVVVQAKVEWMSTSGKMMSDVPLSSHWRIENGQWFWYTGPLTVVQTIVGPVRIPADQAAATMEAKKTTAAQLPQLGPPGAAEAAAMAILGKLAADKDEVRLAGDRPGSAEVTISNGLDSRLTLRLETNSMVPGLEVRLDRTEVEAHGTAKLLVHFEPKGKSSMAESTVRVILEPLGRTFPVRILLDTAGQR